MDQDTNTPATKDDDLGAQHQHQDDAQSHAAGEEHPRSRGENVPLM